MAWHVRARSQSCGDLNGKMIHRIRGGTRKAFADTGRKVDVEVFGSFANGLSTWNSDVDLVITGLMEPDKSTGGRHVHGMTLHGRAAI